MLNTLDDEFMISTHIYGKRAANRINNTSISSAIEWANDAMRTIIIPTEDLQDLEDQWVKFNSMIKKHRRESDWKSIELFGITNRIILISTNRACRMLQFLVSKGYWEMYT